jgi:hypothetical protein
MLVNVYPKPIYKILRCSEVTRDLQKVLKLLTIVSTEIHPVFPDGSDWDQTA